MSEETTINVTTNQVITAEELVNHWQGHRRLTRRIIHAFPEKELFQYSIGGMRPFAQMALELLAIAGPGVREIATGNIGGLSEEKPTVTTKQQILDLWDETTEEINSEWAKIPVERFHEHIKAFGQYEGTVISTVLYYIENEIHHRGQGYVYLRSLGIEPPFFWDR